MMSGPTARIGASVSPIPLPSFRPPPRMLKLMTASTVSAAAGAAAVTVAAMAAAIAGAVLISPSPGTGDDPATRVPTEP